MTQHDKHPAVQKAATVSAGILLAGALAVPAPAAALADGMAAAEEADYRQDARSATNRVRDRHDRVRLDQGRCLQTFAARHSRRMAAQERIWHQDLHRVLRECGLSFAGENVATGFADGDAVVRAWMNSPDHRRNIVEPRFRRMEVVARQGADGRWYATQLFGRR